MDSNRTMLLNNIAVLLEIAKLDSTLDSAVALLCAACAAIAAREEEELVELVRPYMDRTTQQNFPELWELIQQMRRADNAPNN